MRLVRFLRSSYDGAGFAGVVSMSSIHQECVLMRYAAGVLDLKEDGVARLVDRDVGASPFMMKRDVRSFLEVQPTMVLRRKDNEEAVAIASYVERKARLLGFRENDSAEVRSVHRNFNIGVNNHATVELLRYAPLEDEDDMPTIEYAYVRRADVGYYQNGGFIDTGPCVPMISSGRPPRIQPINEPKSHLEELGKQSQGMRRFEKMLEESSKSTRFPLWDLDTNHVMVLRNDNGEWLAGCEV